MNITPFNFNNNEIRTVTKDGEPWFVAKDVAIALGYAIPKNAIAAHCKKAKTLGEITVGLDLQPTQLSASTIHEKAKIIPESDVYRLAMRSKLEGAEAFQDWVVEEVLPAIRKTGSYSVKPMTQMEIVVASAQALLEVERRQLALEAVSEDHDDRLKVLENKTRTATKNKPAGYETSKDAHNKLRSQFRGLAYKPFKHILNTYCQDHMDFYEVNYTDDDGFERMNTIECWDVNAVRDIVGIFINECTPSGTKNMYRHKSYGRTFRLEAC